MAEPLRILQVLRAPVGGLFRHVNDLDKALAGTRPSDRHPRGQSPLRRPDGRAPRGAGASRRARHSPAADAARCFGSRRPHDALSLFAGWRTGSNISIAHGHGGPKAASTRALHGWASAAGVALLYRPRRGARLQAGFHRRQGLPPGGAAPAAADRRHHFRECLRAGGLRADDRDAHLPGPGHP